MNTYYNYVFGMAYEFELQIIRIQPSLTIVCGRYYTFSIQMQVINMVVLLCCRYQQTSRIAIECCVLLCCQTFIKKRKTRTCVFSLTVTRLRLWRLKYHTSLTFTKKTLAKCFGFFAKIRVFKLIISFFHYFLCQN